MTAAFQAAAKKYKVPEELLLAMGYVNTHWEMQQSADGGWGVMHLVKSTGQGTLSRAATLTGHPEQLLESDPAANVDAGAALLAQAQGSKRPSTLDGWAGSVSRAGGGPLYVAQVFAVLQSGAARTTSGGELVTLAVQPVAGPAAAPSAAASTVGGAGADYPSATWIPASAANYTVNDRPTFYPVNLIVIHVTQGSWASAISEFQDPTAQASAHYVVRSSDGAIAQTVREQDVAWHAGNWDYNTRSVGIEHEGFVNDPSWFTDQMYRSSAQLSASLAVKYGIPVDRAHIIGHAEVPDPNNPGQFGGAGHHTDPGPHWNWSLYISYVQQYANAISCTVSYWTLYPGAGNDIAVGPDKSPWLIGASAIPGGFGIFHWTAGGWTAALGAAVRIAVDGSGQPWVVNATGGIFRMAVGGWQPLPGLATDIGIGADGTVWITGWNPVPGGYEIYRWNGASWDRMGGAATRVSVDAHGAAWVVNAAGAIFEWTAGGWQAHAGTAQDIGIGANGSVWLAGKASSGGFDIFRWTSVGWVGIDGGATNVAVGPDGAPWVTNSTGSIFAGRPGVWQAVAGAAHDVGIGADGSVWVTGSQLIDGGYAIYRWISGSGWSQVDGAAVYVAVSPAGIPWVVNLDGSIHRRSAAHWQLLPGSANDIDIGADGSAWIIGSDIVPGGYSIQRWNGTRWSVVPGAGVHIAVGPTGLPWVVNSDGGIWQRTAAGTWQQMPGSARDIGIGADGSVWVTGASATCGGFRVFRWNGSGWDQYDGGGFQIAVGPTGVPWLIDGAGNILLRV